MTKTLDTTGAEALSSDAATSANQITMITALQLIDDLRAALADVATDELRVNVVAELPAGTKNIGDVDVLTMPTVTVQAAGGDKIFGFESIVEEEFADYDLSAGTNTISGTAVGAGKVWKITALNVIYSGTTPSGIMGIASGLAGNLVLIHQTSPSSNQNYFWFGEIYLQAGDYIKFQADGSTAGDDLIGRYVGVQMDAP